MASKSASGRLFVPLAAEPYRWFASGQKRWEVRRYGRQYTERHVVRGRLVELRRGYQSASGSLWGTITAVAHARSLEDFFDQVSFHEVIPAALSREEAIRTATEILGIHNQPRTSVLGFQVTLHDDCDPGDP